MSELQNVIEFDTVTHSLPLPPFHAFFPLLFARVILLLSYFGVNLVTP